MESKRKSSPRFWMEVNGAISIVMLNNLCISLNHFMVFENTEIETSHSRNVYLIESVLEQKLQWSSVEILDFFKVL